MRSLLKKAFAQLPYRKEIFTLVREVIHPSRKIYKHLHFKGDFRVKIDDEASFIIRHHGFYIENELFWGGFAGSRESDSMKLWVKMCMQSDCILDIGANTGVFGLSAQALNPKARVYAFEPVHRVYERLVTNVELNKFPIQCAEIALSDHSGEAVIFDTDEEHILSVTVNRNLQPPGVKVNETKIRISRLDDFINEKSVPPIQLMKLDVETHEPEVLKGMGEFLWKWKPDMIIEILNDDIGNAVQAILEGMGYLFYNLDEQGGIRLTGSITKSDYFNYLICRVETAKRLNLPSI